MGDDRDSRTLAVRLGRQMLSAGVPSATNLPLRKRSGIVPATVRTERRYHHIPARHGERSGVMQFHRPSLFRRAFPFTPDSMTFLT